MTLSTTTGQLAAQIEDADHKVGRKADELEGLLCALLASKKSERSKALEQIASAIHFFKGEVVQHMHVEDEVVFPYLRKHIPRLEYRICLLSAEHRDFTQSLQQFEDVLKKISKQKAGSTLQVRLISELRTCGDYLTSLLRYHVVVESKSIHHAIRCELQPYEQRQLQEALRAYWFTKEH